MIAEFGITKRDILRYTLLPGILPRMGNLLGSGFGTLAYLMALVFNTARLLPNNHPYLRATNVGSYGIRHVLAQAANNLRMDWKYADQYVIFFAILAAIIILIMQFCLIAFAALISTAQAAMPSDFGGFFTTPNPKEDIAFRLLDLVFGIPDFFGSKEAVGTPAQLALQSLFEFYSFGLLLVGFFIIIYFVITIVAETAQSGTPFGKRFNHVWAPIRVVVFFAILLPVTSGMNGGQLVTLAAAKYGSGLATNGWLKFNEVISGEYLGKKEELVGKPQTPEMGYLFSYMLLAQTCRESEMRANGRDIQGYIITGGGADGALPISTSYQDATAANKGGDIHIRFGLQDEEKYKDWSGQVYPHCGELVINTADVSEPGSAAMQEGYLNLVRRMWDDDFFFVEEFAHKFVMKYSTFEPNNPSEDMPRPVLISNAAYSLEKEVTKLIDQAIEKQVAEGKWDPDDNMRDVGWAGAGIWYNKIAQQNGALIMAVANTPKVVMMPRVMEYVRHERLRQNRTAKADQLYNPALADGEVIEYENPEDADVGLVLNGVYEFALASDSKPSALSGQGKMTGNIIIDTVNLLFGTRGLYDLCKDTKIHPLAQLSSMGKNLIESSVRALGFSVLSGAIGGMASLLSEHLATAGFAAASFFMTVASTGLLLGFILFYVIPFMPFLYFFFGVGSWVKGLFEAMVGIPLWALAHLRIDGEGLPGSAASAGYFLILEIFIRPILMVFGLLASIAIFAAMVKVLNEIFYLVVANIFGHDPLSENSCFVQPSPGGASDAADAGTKSDPTALFRGPIDEFFFTVIYAIMVYMIGMSCFKLIDKVPDNILRWISDNVSSFGDTDIDPAEGLVSKIAIAGSMAGELKGGMSGFASLFAGGK
jgi:conjugal transfer/type IV secretion protein DotA/TraY